MISVTLAHPNGLRGDCLEHALNQSRRLFLAGRYTSLKAANPTTASDATTDKHNPSDKPAHVFLTSLQRPYVEDLVQMAACLKRADSAIVVFGSCPVFSDLAAAWQGGAQAYLPITSGTGDLEEAIEQVSLGKAYLRGIPRNVLHRARTAAPLMPSNLTARESEVLVELLRGESAATIAGKLTISRRTVETHSQRICHKYGVRNRYALLAKHRCGE